MGELSAGILIGGASRRMGFPKAHLKNAFGQSLLQQKIDQLAPSVDEILLATAPDIELLPLTSTKPLSILTDQQKFSGPLEGFCTLFQAVKTPFLFITACDMPYFSVALMQQLFVWAKEKQQPIVPLTEDGPMYLFSLFPTQEKSKIFQLRQQHQSLQSLASIFPIVWFEEANWRPIDPQGLSWKNLNTPEEYQQFIQNSRAEKEIPL